MLTDTIKTFIARQIELHPQLADGPLAVWEPGHELQINIDPTGLEPRYVSLAEQDGWTMPDGNRVNHIRIPRGAMTDNPTFRDYIPRGPIHHYWSLIGSTGWHWGQRKSMWVGFDYDSIANHGNGLAPEQLQEVLDRARELPYVVARTSKGGKGVHLLVPLSPWVTTRNHIKHSQLAGHVLARMSNDCGFNFQAAADVCGGNLWHWQRGLKEDGLRRINEWATGR